MQGKNTLLCLAYGRVKLFSLPNGHGEIMGMKIGQIATTYSVKRVNILPPDISFDLLIIKIVGNISVAVNKHTSSGSINY